MRNAFDPCKYSIESIRKYNKAMEKRITIPQNACIEKVQIDGVNAEWLSLHNKNTHAKKVILYIHSGGFCFGLGNNHRDFALRIAKITGIKVLAVDYRLAPEHTYPAAMDDCNTAYKWLLKNGYSSDNIIFGGDSAGASLALMSLLSLKHEDISLPKASFFLSMMGGDLTDFDGESYESRKDKDPLNSKKYIEKYARLFLGSAKVESPIKQDLTGLPDMFIQVGNDEVLLSDSLLLSERAENSGLSVTLEIWDGMWHVFQGFASIVPESQKAIDSLGRFILSKM
jgi:acetyl esterase/lipase